MQLAEPVPSPADFRDGAADASRSLTANQTDSYCLILLRNPAGVRSWMKWIGGIAILIQLPCLAFIMPVLLLQILGVSDFLDRYAGLFLAASFAASLLGPVPTLSERYLARWYIRRRNPEVFADLSHRALHVAVEDEATYKKIKLLADDVGYMRFFPETRCIQIDGLAYRYRIVARDVIRLSLHSNGKTVLLTYEAAGVPLSLAVSSKSILSEMRKLTTGSSKGLYKRLQRTLGLNAARGFEIIPNAGLPEEVELASDS